MAQDLEATPARPPDRSGSGVRLRPALEALPHYVPGAAGLNGSVFKLSSNEVPGPVLPAVTAAILDAAEDVNRYPQMYADRLTQALAQRHGLDPDQVLCGNGSVSVLDLLLRSACTEGDEVVHAWRSFEAYPILIQATGARGVPVPVDAEGRHDLEAMAAAVTDRTRVVLVCTPNNPTSTAVRHRELEAFLARIPPHVMVVLDEAYLEFVDHEDAVDALALLPTYKNLVILRTFSKAYGLAGLRLGYALARRRLIRTLRAASTPFGVNGLAQAAGLAALAHQDAMRRRVAEVTAERERVVDLIRAQGWELPEVQGNFYWLGLREYAGAFAQDATGAGITVRPFAGEGVRISIGEPEANDIAVALAARWTPNGPRSRS